MIYEHGPVEELVDGLWWVKARHALPIHRNMVVARLPSGGLLLHSVVAMHEDGMRALEALGDPEIMIVPHAKHGMDAPFFARRYPELRIACPEQSRDEVQRRYELTIEGPPEHVLEGTGIAAHPVDGARFHECALEVPLGDGVALVFNDAVANHGRESGGVGGFLMGLTGVPGGGFGVSRTMRLFTADKAALRGFLQRMSELDVRLITMSHGDPVRDDPQGELRRIAGTV